MDARELHLQLVQRSPQVAPEIVEKRQSRDVCHHCDSPRLRDSSGSIVCVDCGVVQGYVMNKWVVFDKSGANTRSMTASENFPELSLSILKHSYQDSTTMHFHRKMATVKRLIYGQCGGKLSDHILKRAIGFIKEVYQSGKILRGRNFRALHLGAVYYSSRVEEYPIFLNDIVRLFDVERKMVIAGIDIFMKTCREKKLTLGISSIPLTPPEAFIERISIAAAQGKQHLVRPILNRTRLKHETCAYNGYVSFNIVYMSSLVCLTLVDMICDETIERSSEREVQDLSLARTLNVRETTSMKLNPAVAIENIVNLVGYKRETIFTKATVLSKKLESPSPKFAKLGFNR